MIKYTFFLILFQTLLIIFIGIPTIYALIWGVPFVPTPKSIIKNLIQKLPIKKDMTIYELGCGDARFLTSASKKEDIKLIGFEFSPLVFLWARLRNWLYRGKNVKVLYKDYNNHNFYDADMIFCYLLPKRNSVIIKKLQKECKKDTLIVSYAFPIKELQPIEIIPSPQKFRHNPTYVYKV